MADDRRIWLVRLCDVLKEVALKKQFGSWWGTERGWLYYLGLLGYPLPQLIPLWMHELARVGLQGGKDGWLVDLPRGPGAVAVDVGNGQTLWIDPDAYQDEDGSTRAEVRDIPMRTDLAVLGALVPLEGGEPDPGRLWDDYQLLFAGREPRRAETRTHVDIDGERALMLANALLQQRNADRFGGASEPESRERVTSIARRIGKVHKALRELALDLESGTLRRVVQDAQLDVFAAELHFVKGLPWVEVGRRLDIPQSGPSDKTKNDNQRARKAGERGREYLRKAGRTLP